jgi:hypothetical protein
MAISRKNKKITKNNKKIKVKTTLKRRINKKTRYVRKMKGGAQPPPDVRNNSDSGSDWNKNDFVPAEPEGPAGPAGPAGPGPGPVSLELPSHPASAASTNTSASASATANSKQEKHEVDTNTIEVVYPRSFIEDQIKQSGPKTSSWSAPSKDTRKEKAAHSEYFKLTDIIDTVIGIIKKLHNDVSKKDWISKKFSDGSKKNQVIKNLQTNMTLNPITGELPISNNSRNEKIKKFSIVSNFNAHGKFKKKINLTIEGTSARFPSYTINLLDEMYNLIVYIIATNKNEYHEDVDKMIALLSLLLQSKDNYNRHQTIMDYLASKNY